MSTNIVFKCSRTGTQWALNPTQIYNINNGRTSTYPSDNIVNVALGHAAYKSLKGLPGDEYVRWSQVEREDNTCATADHGVPLIGPNTAISTGQKRIMIIRMVFLAEDCGCPGFHDETANSQPRCWTSGREGQVKRVDKMAHVVFDNKGLVFADATGETLYVSRSHLIMAAKIAKVDQENKLKRFGKGNAGKGETSKQDETSGHKTPRNNKKVEKPHRPILERQNAVVDETEKEDVNLDDSFDEYIKGADLEVVPKAPIKKKAPKTQRSLSDAKRKLFADGVELGVDEADEADGGGDSPVRSSIVKTRRIVAEDDETMDAWEGELPGNQLALPGFELPGPGEVPASDDVEEKKKKPAKDFIRKNPDLFSDE